MNGDAVPASIVHGTHLDPEKWEEVDPATVPATEWLRVLPGPDGKPIFYRRRQPKTAKVILFKPSGKYYSSEEWEIPEDAIGPHDMARSKDFRRFPGGAVLVEDEPWGFPHLFPTDPTPR